MTNPHLINLPVRFWRDHSERGLPSGKVVRQGRITVLLECDDETLAEIESDARYYCDPNGPDTAGLSGIKASARATVLHIEAYRRTLATAQGAS